MLDWEEAETPSATGSSNSDTLAELKTVAAEISELDPSAMKKSPVSNCSADSFQCSGGSQLRL